MSLKQAGILPVPDHCHACGSDEIRITVIKSGRRAWVCDSCDAFVTCHDGTENPVGFMAGDKTRELRKAAHIAFDVLWKERLMSRNKAYHWLANVLKIPRDAAHISWLSNAQLRELIEIATAYYADHAETLLRRKERNDEKRGKRHARQNAEERRKIIERKRRRY